VRDPVAIVAAGVVTSIGQDLDAFWSSLLTGGAGITRIERFPVADLRRRARRRNQEAPAGAPARPECRRPGCCSRLRASSGRAAARCCRGTPPAWPLSSAPRSAASRRASAPSRARPACDLGGRPLRQPGAEPRARARRARTRPHGVDRLRSGATALGVGAELVREGVADLVVAGGYDVLCRFVMKGFDVLRALTRDAIRPFDRRGAGPCSVRRRPRAARARAGRRGRAAAWAPPRPRERQRTGRTSPRPTRTAAGSSTACGPRSPRRAWRPRRSISSAPTGRRPRSTTGVEPLSSSGARAAGARDPGQLDQGLHGHTMGRPRRSRRSCACSRPATASSRPPSASGPGSGVRPRLRAATPRPARRGSCSVRLPALAAATRASFWRGVTAGAPAARRGGGPGAPSGLRRRP